MGCHFTDALAAVAPDGVAIGWLGIDDSWVGRLHPSERALVRSARHARMCEFATGRALLHSMLPGVTWIGRTANGGPAVGSATVASLAHDRHHAIAAVASRDDFLAVGIDLEPSGGPNDAELAAAVLRDDEQFDPVGALVAKEATYKAWSGLGGTVLEPHDVRVDVYGSRFVSSVMSAGRAAGLPTSFAGAIVHKDGYWSALVAVPLRAFRVDAKNNSSK